MIDFDEIRKQVSVQHNVLLGKDDPILVCITLNELVLRRYLELAAEEYKAANRGLIISIGQQLEQTEAAAKESAGRVITDASDYVSRQVRKAVDSAVDEAQAKLVQQVIAAQAASRDAQDKNSDAQAARRGAILAACVASLAAVAAIAATAAVVLVSV